MSRAWLVYALMQIKMVNHLHRHRLNPVPVQIDQMVGREAHLQNYFDLRFRFSSHSKS